ncbi:type VII secretion protein EccB [Streptomyces clavuligerus]|nr:type VII secretion protein EccB [Streptomyces clavuligerus]
MASRRDELNAYTFAKRRLIAQFLQPSTTGSEEGAPRPLRAVVPGAIAGVVVLAGFAAWGMFRPVAPRNWDTPGENVIIASRSTTRYVVLETDGEKQLHPVLNMSSAKLLLDPDKGKVIKVAESVLDKGDIPRGATLGIPYAPDRLPSAKEAGSPKRWAVCERPGDGGRTIQKAAFLLAPREQDRTEGPDRLRGGELLHVEGPDRTRYIVDASGTAYPLATGEHLLRQLVGQGRAPQRVSRAWLDTLHRGDRVDFPEVPPPGTDAGIPPSELPSALNEVGTVLEASDGARKQKYVVLPGRVAPVSDFTAELLLNSKALVHLGQGGRAERLSSGAFTPGRAFHQEKKWPQRLPEAVDSASTGQGGRNTVCLGYGGVEPGPVPAAWSAFLPTGPRLSTGSARQPQGS